MFKSYDIFMPKDLQEGLVDAQIGLPESISLWRTTKGRASQWLRSTVMAVAEVEYAVISTTPAKGSKPNGSIPSTDIHADYSFDRPGKTFTRFAVAVSNAPSAATMIFEDAKPHSETYTHDIFARDENGLLVPRPGFEDPEHQIDYKQAQNGQLYSFYDTDSHAAPPLYDGEVRVFMYSDVVRP